MKQVRIGQIRFSFFFSFFGFKHNQSFLFNPFFLFFPFLCNIKKASSIAVTIQRSSDAKQEKILFQQIKNHVEKSFVMRSVEVSGPLLFFSISELCRAEAVPNITFYDS